MANQPHTTNISSRSRTHMMLNAKLIYYRHRSRTSLGNIAGKKGAGKLTVARLENSLLNEGTYPRASSSLSSSLGDRLCSVIDGVGRESDIFAGLFQFTFSLLSVEGRIREGGMDSGNLSLAHPPLVRPG